MAKTHEKEITKAKDEKIENEELKEYYAKTSVGKLYFNGIAKTKKELFEKSDKLEQITYPTESIDSVQQKSKRTSSIAEIKEDYFKKVDAVFYEVYKKTPPQNKKSNLKKGILIGLGIVVITGAVGGIVYGLIQLFSKGESTTDNPIPKEQQDEYQELYNAWLASPDEDVWEMFAQYKEFTPTTSSVNESVGNEAESPDQPPTIADQLYFCNYIADIGQTSEADVWIWDSSDDEMKIVDELVDIYNKSSPQTTAVLYRNITKMTYQDKTLPRNVAGEVLVLTLAKILDTME